jgi:phenylacetate-CoA ligase
MSTTIYNLKIAWCPPGKIGRVVVTSLHNYRMPLIRYDIGDLAIAGNTCDCGITLPVIKRILGRNRNLVIYPNGDKSWPSYNPMKLMDIFPNAQFQLLQTSLTELELRVNITTPLQESQIQAAQAVIRKAIGYDFNIAVHPVKNIKRAASGKFEESICQVE